MENIPVAEDVTPDSSRSSQVEAQSTPANTSGESGVVGEGKGKTQTSTVQQETAATSSTPTGLPVMDENDDRMQQ